MRTVFFSVLCCALLLQSPDRPVMVSVEIGLLLRDGSARPMARAEVLLYDLDPLDAICKADLATDRKTAARYFWWNRDAPERAAWMGKIDSLLKPHLLATTTTGLDGKVEVKLLKEPAALWVAATAFASGRGYVWSQAAPVAEGRSRLTLDQTTAAGGY